MTSQSSLQSSSQSPAELGAEPETAAETEGTVLEPTVQPPSPPSPAHPVIRFGTLAAQIDPPTCFLALGSYLRLFSELGQLVSDRLIEQIDDPEMLPELLKRQREEIGHTASLLVDALGQSATLAILRTAREILDEYLVEAEAFVAIRRKNGHFE